MQTETAQQTAPATLWAIGRYDGSYTEIVATGLSESEAAQALAQYRAKSTDPLNEYWSSPIRPAKGGV
jgi:hypothetical protein